MISRTLFKWILSGLFSVSLMALPACQSTSKGGAEALTGEVDRSAASRMNVPPAPGPQINGKRAL